MSRRAAFRLAAAALAAALFALAIAVAGPRTWQLWVRVRPRPTPALLAGAGARPRARPARAARRPRSTTRSTTPPARSSPSSPPRRCLPDAVARRAPWPGAPHVAMDRAAGYGLAHARGLPAVPGDGLTPRGAAIVAAAGELLDEEGTRRAHDAAARASAPASRRRRCTATCRARAPIEAALIGAGARGRRRRLRGRGRRRAPADPLAAIGRAYRAFALAWPASLPADDRAAAARSTPAGRRREPPRRRPARRGARRRRAPRARRLGVRARHGRTSSSPARFPPGPTSTPHGTRAWPRSAGVRCAPASATPEPPQRGALAWPDAPAHPVHVRRRQRPRRAAACRWRPPPATPATASPSRGAPTVVAELAERGFPVFADAASAIDAPADVQPLAEVDLAHEQRAVRDGFAARVAPARAASVVAPRDGVAARRRRLRRRRLRRDDRGGAPRAAVRHGRGQRAGLRATGPRLAAAGRAARVVRAHGRSDASPHAHATCCCRPSRRATASRRSRRPGAPLRPGASPAPPELRPDGGARPCSSPSAPSSTLESGDLFPRLLAALRALPVDAVVTVGRELDPARFGAQPPGDRRRAPRAARRRAAALRRGRQPRRLRHRAGDARPRAAVRDAAARRRPAAARGALRRAGRRAVLDALTATPAELAAAVLDVLREPSFRAAASRLRPTRSPRCPAPERRCCRSSPPCRRRTRGQGSPTHGGCPGRPPSHADSVQRCPSSTSMSSRVHAAQLLEQRADLGAVQAEQRPLALPWSGAAPSLRRAMPAAYGQRFAACVERGGARRVDRQVLGHPRTRQARRGRSPASAGRGALPTSAVADAARRGPARSPPSAPRSRSAPWRSISSSQLGDQAIAAARRSRRHVLVVVRASRSCDVSAT